MSDKVQIGKLITGDSGRDAIHIAIAPVVASDKLAPGQRIGFVDGSTERVEAKIGASLASEVIGIVDPFIPTLVEAEQRFYMFLLPNTITSLRHQWTHPAFPSAEPVHQQARAEAVAYLTAFGSEHGLDYDEVLSVAERYLKWGDYLCEGGRFEGCSVPDEFWNYYEHATGRVVPNGDRGSFFSCSC